MPEPAHPATSQPANLRSPAVGGEVPPAAVDYAPNGDQSALVTPPQVRAETVVHPAATTPRTEDAAPRRRVRGANLGGLTADMAGQTAAPRDADAVRAALTGLQGGVRNARNELAITRDASFDAAVEPTPVAGFGNTSPSASAAEPASTSSQPDFASESAPGSGQVPPAEWHTDPDPDNVPTSELEQVSHPGPDEAPAQQPALDTAVSPASPVPAAAAQRRRVRGAQLPDLGDGTEFSGSGSRDAARARAQMGGLQASVARARRDAAARLRDGRPAPDDDSTPTLEEKP